MYISKKWFFFIEWSIMTMLAWFGVLSAALFPSMTSYLSRSRDAGRVAHLNTISTAVWAYYSDNETYPETSPSWCFAIENAESFFPMGIPKDPSGIASTWCDGSLGMTYAYKKVSIDETWSHFILSATMEWARSGNSSYSADMIDAENLEQVMNARIKWSGKEFIISSY
jgi:Tfp pilus assembly protein PilE